MKKQLARATKTNEIAKNAGNEINIELTPEEMDEIFKLLLEIRLKETLIEIVFLFIKVSKGRVYFEITYNELAEEFFSSVIDDSKEKKRRRKVVGGRMRSVRKWQQKNNITFFEILSVEENGYSGDKRNRANPHIIKCDLILMKTLLNISGSAHKSSRSRIEILRQEYLSELINNKNSIRKATK